MGIDVGGFKLEMICIPVPQVLVIMVAFKSRQGRELVSMVVWLRAAAGLLSVREVSST
jgi:hypothetical protein